MKPNWQRLLRLRRLLCYSRDEAKRLKEEALVEIMAAALREVDLIVDAEAITLIETRFLKQQPAPATPQQEEQAAEPC